MDMTIRGDQLGALAGGGVAAVCKASGHLALSIGGAVLAGGLLLRPGRAHIAHLRVARALHPVLAPMMAVLALFAVHTVLHAEAMSTYGWFLVAVATATASAVGESLRRQGIIGGCTRAAFIGSAAAGDHLARDLDRADVRRFHLIGRVAVERDLSGDLPVIGELGGLRAALVDSRIDLLVLGGGVPRSAVFDEFAEACLDLRVRIAELPVFCEDVFGYVPVSEINAAWFARLVDAHARQPVAWVKRALDLAMVGALGVLALPVLAVLAYLVRLDGGPALYAQTRIGEHGRPFRLYKLRTMRLAPDAAATWTAHDDPRVTRLGRLLRNTHLDELPQLWNIARGEMSFVGPRPEQPAFVEHLERVLPFYQRRHLIRPGLTGWAQMRCGYADSDEASAWKLCNDLYYYKHRSLGVDLLVLAETAGQIVLGRFGGVRHPRRAGRGLAAPTTLEIQPVLAELASPTVDGAFDGL